MLWYDITSEQIEIISIFHKVFPSLLKAEPCVCGCSHEIIEQKEFIKFSYYKYFLMTSFEAGLTLLDNCRFLQKQRSLASVMAASHQKCLFLLLRWDRVLIAVGSHSRGLGKSVECRQA